jgi:hypothetical protein
MPRLTFSSLCPCVCSVFIYCAFRLFLSSCVCRNRLMCCSSVLACVLACIVSSRFSSLSPTLSASALLLLLLFCFVLLSLLSYCSSLEASIRKTKTSASYVGISRSASTEQQKKNHCNGQNQSKCDFSVNSPSPSPFPKPHPITINHVYESARVLGWVGKNLVSAEDHGRGSAHAIARVFFFHVTAGTRSLPVHVHGRLQEYV